MTDKPETIRTFDYYYIRKDAAGDARYLRDNGEKSRIEKGVGRGNRATGYKPWRLIVIEKDR